MEKKNTHIAYGLITGIIMVVVSIILYITGVMFKPEYRFISSVSYGVFLAGIIMNAVAFSKSRDGFVTFGNVFGSCFKATLIIAAIITIWSAISLFVFPDMKDKIIEMTREQMMKKNLPDEQIDMAIEMTRKSWNVFMFAGAILGTMLVGAIFSLIGGAVAKKKGEPPMASANF